MTSKIKATFAQISSFKNRLKGTCALPISVGQPYHEAEKMYATVELINKYFSKCVFIVCDSLQRYTLMLYGNLSEMGAYKEAFKDGATWIERNQKTFQQLDIPYDIVRWDNWYKSDRFDSYLMKIDNLLSIDYNFKNILDSCANDFIEQHFSCYNENIFSMNRQSALILCENYLKEEAAVLLMWQEEDYSFLAYPGSNNEVMANVRSYFFSKEEELSKLLYLKIKFKK